MKHLESRLQSICVRYFRLSYPEYSYCLLSVPNGVATSASQGRILKAEGMVAGASDLLLLVPRHGYGCLCLEFKTKDGRQSESQKIWQRETEKVCNKYVIIRSFDQFRAVIEEYLGYSNGIKNERDTLQRLTRKDG